VHVIGHGDRIFKGPEVTQQGSLDERAPWESIGGGRRKRARPDLVKASRNHGHRYLDCRDATPRSAGGGLTKDFGFGGRTAPQRNGAVQGGREAAIDIRPESVGMELVERRL
jgi:hypothetical protein